MPQTENNKATSSAPSMPTSSEKSMPSMPGFPGISDWMRPETWTRFVSGEPVTKAVEEQMNRMGAMWEEFAKTEKMALDQAQSAVQEFSRLALASIDYGARLTGEIRRTTIEASRRGVEFFRNGSNGNGRS